MAIKFLNTVAVDTDVLYVDASSNNVGIGTTSPQTTLHLYDTEGSILRLSSDQHGDTNKIEFDATNLGAIYHSITSNTNSGNLQIRAGDGGSGHEVNIYTDGQFAATFDHNQRLGIGTTSPGAKLEVAGDMNLYNPSATSQINFRNIAGANYIKSNGYSTQFGLRGNTGNGVFIIENSLAATQDIRIKPTTSGWDFSSRGVAGVNALLTIDSVLNISNKTNVGIGTTAPSTPLHINADAPTIRLQDATSGDNHYLTGNNGELRVQSSGYITMRPGAAVSTTFLANGNVGIGTTSPDYPLHVDATIKIGDRQGTDGSLILQSQQGPNITFKSTGDVLDISGTTGATNGNSIRLSDNIKKLYFNGGIGGTIAINRGNRGLMDSNVGGLEVQQQDTASSNGKSTFLSTSSLGTILRSTSYGSTGTSGDIQFQFGGGGNTSEPSPATKMIIKNSGNVGIGTTSPSVALEVQQSADNQGLKILGFDDESNSNLHFYVDNFGNDRITSSEFLNITSGGSSSYTAAGYLRLRGVGSTSQVELDGSTIKFTVTSSEKMRLTSTGLGIGTTAPTAKLQIDSTSGWGVFTERGIKDGSTSTYSHNYSAGNAHILGRAMYFENAAVFSTSTADATTKEYRFSNASDKLIVKSLVAGNTFDDNILVLSGSNVGIGTASPLNKLQVSDGSVGIDSQYMIRDNRNNTILQQSANTVASNRSLTIGNATYSNVIIPNGNVGIGTTNPARTLDVAGRGRFVDSTGTVDICSSTYVPLLITNTNGYAHARINGFEVGGNTTANNEGYIKTSDNSRKLILDTNGWRFLAQSAELMRITSSGNVGIGTTSPSTALHIKSTSAGGGYATIENTVHLAKLQLKSATYTGSLVMDGTGGYISGGGLILDSGTHPKTQFLQGGVSKMIINNGDVGIGTASPSEKLDVEGNIRVGVNNGFYINNQNVGIKRVANDLVVGGFGGIRFTSSSTTVPNQAERMRITSSGNVGIGTTSPVAKLDVNGNIRTNNQLTVYNSDLSRQSLIIKSEAATNTGLFKLSNGSNWGLLMQGYSNSPYIGAYFNGLLNITGFEDSDGTTPSAIKLAQFVFGGTGGGSGYLTLNGDLKVNTNKKIKFGYGNSQTNGIEWVSGSKISAAITPVDAANYSRTGLGFFTGDFSDGTTNAAERMRITRAGNVGIGNTSPSQKLEVDGEVLSDGYRVSAMQTAPAARNSTGTLGEIRITSNYIYICYATNSWSRVALATSW